MSDDEVRAWVGGLPVAEKDDVLARLITHEDLTLVAGLLQQFRRDREGSERTANASAARRTVGELLQAAQVRTEERRQAKARKRAEEAARREREAAAARAKYLDDIAGRRPQLWTRINGLIATKQPKRYDEAVGLLTDLRDLAQRDGKEREFRLKLESLHADHARKPSFLERLRKAGL